MFEVSMFVDQFQKINQNAAQVNCEESKDETLYKIDPQFKAKLESYVQQAEGITNQLKLSSSINAHFDHQDIDMSISSFARASHLLRSMNQISGILVQRRGYKLECMLADSSTKKLFEECDLVVKYSKRQHLFILEIRQINQVCINRRKTNKFVISIKKGLSSNLVHSKESPIFQSSNLTQFRNLHGYSIDHQEIAQFTFFESL